MKLKNKTNKKLTPKCPKCGGEMEYIEPTTRDIRCDSPSWPMYWCNDCPYSCLAD